MKRTDISDRRSSHPLISGDTFRAEADFVLDKGDEPELAEQIPPMGGGQVLMCEFDFIAQPGALQTVADLGRRSARNFGGSPALVLHNGDSPPSQGALEALVDSGWRVFCPNIVEKTPGVTAVPLGIENLHWKKNGILETFVLERVRRQKLSPPPARTREIFCSFNPLTNPPLRQKVIGYIEDSRHTFLPAKMTPERYKKALSESFFVISPPGNGPDCHRTWEAIYTGAVPIVLRGTLNADLAGSLPIWEVDDFREPLNSTPAELWDAYLEQNSKNSEKAYFLYWQGSIRANPMPPRAARASHWC